MSASAPSAADAPASSVVSHFSGVPGTPATCVRVGTVGWPVVVTTVAAWWRVEAGGAGDAEVGATEAVGEVTVEGGCCFFLSVSL